MDTNIGTFLKTNIYTYMLLARQTGRTTLMINRVNDGDQIIFADRKEAERVRNLLKQIGKKVACHTIPPTKAHFVVEYKYNKGKTFFDHTWIEQYYLDCINRSEQYLDHLQQLIRGEKNADEKTDGITS